MSISNVLGRPGVYSGTTATHNFVFRDGSAGYYPGGGTIDGTKSRNPANSADTILLLTPGMIMGKVTSGGKYAPSILGVSAGAITGAGTTLSASAAVATELARRVGTTGTFKLTGPPTAAGTVRTLTATYSAVNTSTGDITITALGVADVWTLTAPAGQDAGYYQLEVTTGKGTSAESTQVTAALAANANSATVDAALEALTNVGASGVAAVYADPTLTLTFASNLGPVQVRVLADTTNDGGAFEGGWAAVHTTTGVDGRFIAGSFIQPTDGSETPVTVIPDGFGVLLDGTNDASFPVIPVTGLLQVDKIGLWPSDTSLKAWVRTALSTLSGGKFAFSDQF